MLTRRTVEAAVNATIEWLADAAHGSPVTVAERAALEDVFARTAVNGLLKLSAAELRGRSRLSGYDGIFVAQRLLETYDAVWYSWTPIRSLALTDAALVIASRCDRSSPALLVRAWKERATALRVLGRFDE